MGKGGCCRMAGIVVPSTAVVSVAVAPDVGSTVGLGDAPGDGDVAAGVAVEVAGTGTVLVSVILAVGASNHRSPGAGCPAKAMVPLDRIR